jgi:hypothetical protein
MGQFAVGVIGIEPLAVSPSRPSAL